MVDSRKAAGREFEHAESIARAFLTSDDPAAKASLLRFPDRNRDLVEQYYAGRETAAETFDGFRHLGGLSEVPDCVAAFLCRLENGGHRILAILPRGDGDSLGIDWECFARHNPLSWNAFQERFGSAGPGEVHDGEFRVIVDRSDYYNFDFESRDHWQSIAVRIPGNEDPVYGYARRGSAVRAELERRIAAGRHQRVILKLESTPDSAARNQFRITELVSPEWVKM